MTTGPLKLWIVVPILMAEALEVATVKGVGIVGMGAGARAGETTWTRATGLAATGGASTAESAATVAIKIAAGAWTERGASTTNTKDPEAEAGAWIERMNMTGAMVAVGVCPETTTGEPVLKPLVRGKPRAGAETGLIPAALPLNCSLSMTMEHIRTPVGQLMFSSQKADQMKASAQHLLVRG